MLQSISAMTTVKELNGKKYLIIGKSLSRTYQVALTANSPTSALSNGERRLRQITSDKMVHIEVQVQ